MLTYREMLSCVDLSYECTNTLKPLRKSRTMSCEHANVQRNVGKARLINRRTYLRTEKRCGDVTLGRKTIVRT